MTGLRTRVRADPTYRYYREGFPDALWEMVRWMNHPHAWWGWFIAAPLWPFTAHIVVVYQFKRRWAPEDRFGER